jgi:hypothetical protein
MSESSPNRREFLAASAAASAASLVVTPARKCEAKLNALPQFAELRAAVHQQRQTN